VDGRTFGSDEMPGNDFLIFYGLGPIPFGEFTLSPELLPAKIVYSNNSFSFLDKIVLLQFFKVGQLCPAMKLYNTKSLC